MTSKTTRQTRDRETGESFTVRLVGIDGFDLALWNDAWKTHPERMSWARATSEREQKNGNYTVTMDVDRKGFAAICDPEWEATKLSDLVCLALNEIAHEAAEDDYWRAEVMSLPQADDQVSLPVGGIVVEWQLSEAAWVVQSVQLSTGDVSRMVLHRIDVGPEIARLRVRLPDALSTALASKTGEAETMTERVLAVIEAAYSAEQHARVRAANEADDTEIPF